MVFLNPTYSDQKVINGYFTDMDKVFNETTQ